MTGTSRTAATLVLTGPRRLEPTSVPLPELGLDDGLLRVEACGLCGTDHEQYFGHLPVAGPTIPGHEVVGVIEAAGPRAAARWGAGVGDRVAVEVYPSCRDCGPCRRGDYRHCERHSLADLLGFVPLDRAPGLWGGYSEYLYLQPDAMVLPVPDGLDPVLATLFNPLGAGIRWGVTVAGTGPGDVVAILGPGVRGLSTLVAVRDAGAGFVMVTGHGARDAARLDTAARLGADLVVDVATDDPVRALRTATGGGADVVVDVTAMAPTAFAQAQAIARTGGTVVYAGTRGAPDVPGFAPDTIVYKELRLIGALGVDVAAYRAALDLLSRRTELFAAWSREVVGFDGLGPLLERMAGHSHEAPPLHGVVVPGPEDASP